MPARWLFGARPRRTLARAVVLAAVAAVVFGVVLKPVRTAGVSMTPTHRDGELLFYNALAYRGGGPARGDVVAFRFAGPGVVLVKRVVGLPGERVRIDGGVVVVDGAPLDEPYVAARHRWDFDEVRVGDDEYFVMGDNRAMPMAHHDFGRVHRGRVLGEVVW